MKAIVYRSYGNPDVLRVEDVARPEPGDGEVLVQNHAVSINAWDWEMLTGRPLEYRLLSGIFSPRKKMIHGCDIAGRVVSAGKGVRTLSVGDEVFGDLSEHGWGAYAEYTCAPESSLRRKPAEMTFIEAACLPHGGNLAVQGLVDFGNVKAGQRVLINGGGGSTGTLAIQIAKLLSAEVTAVDHTTKLEKMLELGADHVIDFTQSDFTRDRNRYDLVFDVKTDRSAFRYRRSLRPNGAYVTVGGNSFYILQAVSLGKLSRKCRMHLLPYVANKDSDYLVELYQAGKLKPVIDRCFPLEKTAEAFRYFGEGRCTGKVVVTVDSEAWGQSKGTG